MEPLTIVEKVMFDVIILQDTSQSYDSLWGNSWVPLRAEHGQRERWSREEVVEFAFLRNL